MNVGSGNSLGAGQDKSVSAFNDEITANFNPLVGIKATYGLLNNVQTFSATGGSATVSNNEYVCQSGTSAGGYGTIWSAKPIVYFPGIGCEGRITARFTTGIATSIQLAGMFTAADGMMFGYNGADFGVLHRHGGKLEIRTLTVGTGASGAESLTIELNGTEYSAAVTSGTATQNAFEIADDLIGTAANNLWYIQQVGATVVFVYRGIGEQASDYAFTNNTGGGTCAATFARDNAGADPTETWTLRENWDLNPTWFDPTKGNLFKVEFAYLGYGHLNYYIMNPLTQKWVKVHTVKWPNNNTQTNFDNPSLRIGWTSASLGSSGTNLTVSGGSGMIALQGNVNENKRNFGAVGNNTAVGTSEEHILSVQIRREFGNKFCNALSYPSINVGTDSTKGMIFRVYLNTTISGTLNYQYIDETDSIGLYDTAGTTVSGGELIGAYPVGAGGTATIPAANLNKVLTAGDTITITGQVTSGADSGGFATINTNEII